MTSSYEIHEWNQTIDASNRIRPVFTFSPDPQFIMYIQKNPGIILMEIKGSTYYDGQHFGTCLSSADFPTFGSNYYEDTKSYVIVLDTDFTDTPSSGGNMNIVEYAVRTPPTNQQLHKDDDHERNPSNFTDTSSSTVNGHGSEYERTSVSTIFLIVMGIITFIIIITATLLIYYRHIA
jgi:hypothetical protein